MINIYCYNAFWACLEMHFSAAHEYTRKPILFTIGNSMRALSIDVKAHAGYHLFLLPSTISQEDAFVGLLALDHRVNLYPIFSHTHTNSYKCNDTNPTNLVSCHYFVSTTLYWRNPYEPFTGLFLHEAKQVSLQNSRYCLISLF